MAFGGRPFGTAISQEQFKGDQENRLWPGMSSGLPVKVKPGDELLLKGDEVENLPIELIARSRMFELWRDDDKQAFDEICNYAVNHVYFIRFRSERWDEEHNHFRIWMEWIEANHVIPKKTSLSRPGNG